MDTSAADFQPMESPRASDGPKKSSEGRGRMCGCVKQHVEEVARTAAVNVPVEKQYGDNSISTSKYTLVSFIPRSLFEQFRRIANVYFLGISILMLIGEFLPKIFETPLSAYSTLGPLCIVLAITMAKEGAEDYKRHASDNEVNNRRVPVLQPDGSERMLLWHELRVGHIIRVENKGEVPADIILLQTSEPRAICYIETSNIDGETNLKLKEGLPITATAYSKMQDLARAKGEMEYEPPNASIHTFAGKFRLQGGQYVPVGARNMVLRGCTLRNTKWVAGLVVYTGRDTKVMKKSGGARSKMSQVEKTMNTCIQVIFAAQFVLCTVTTVALALWDAAFAGNYSYLNLSDVSMWVPDWLGNWFTFLILFNNFIPISLYVTVEMVNYVQAWMIDQDADMYDPGTNTPAKARTSNLNQDLGQIEYVFSDKTGTLTRNVMEFKQCSVAGRVFGTFSAEADLDEEERQRELAEHEAEDARLHAAEARNREASGGWMSCCSRGRGKAAGSRNGASGGHASSWRGTAPARRPARGTPGREGSALELAGGTAPTRATSPLSATSAPRERAPSPLSTLSNPMKASATVATPHRTAGVTSPVSGLMSPTSGFDDPVLASVLRDSNSVPGFGAGWSGDVGARAASSAIPASGGSISGGVTAPLAVAAVAGGLTVETLHTLEAFFTCMAVCHTVVPETNDAGGPPVYQAESPDEAALTKAARELGFEFVERQADHIVVRRVNAAHAAELRFDVLGVHEFNSTRKRMAVVVRAPDGRTLLMVKGADNVIFERAVLEPGRHMLDAHLTKFASDGLRTLVLAQREMSPAEYAQWRQEYDEASVALEKRDAKLAAVAERYEVNLHVLGATAIEDRLQDGVPGTIHDLARAGIKTWVLTGDKVETAINIGFSCRLLDPSMELLQIVSEDERVLEDQIDVLYSRFAPLIEDPRGFLKRWFAPAPKSIGSPSAMSTRPSSPSLTNVVKLTGPGASTMNGAVAAGPAQLARAMEHASPYIGPRGSLQTKLPPGSPQPRGGSLTGFKLDAQSPGSPGTSSPAPTLETTVALVVTGLALNHILGRKGGDAETMSPLAKKFLTIARCCKAVIACRVSPAQKAQIVRLVRKGIQPSPMTLAIGDGANDVGMIQRAEVGIGISGKEGMQAVNSADFAIAQFRFLRRLLLVHGRWSYRRMTKVVLYSFYKNVVITLTLFYYTALAGFSGTSFYESLVYSTYNFVLGLPIIFIGILDRDLSARTVLDHPAVYTVGMNFMDLNVSKMMQWIMRAILHSGIVFWLPYGVYASNHGVMAADGQVDGLSVAGLLTFSSLLWAMQIKVAIETLTWTWINWLFIGLSMLGYYVFILAYANMLSVTPDFYGVATATMASPTYWLTVALVMAGMYVVDTTIQLARLELFPAATDIAIELDRGYGTPGPSGVVRWGDEDGAASTVLPPKADGGAAAMPAAAGTLPVFVGNAAVATIASTSPANAGAIHPGFEGPERSISGGRLAVATASGDGSVMAPVAPVSRRNPASSAEPSTSRSGPYSGIEHSSSRVFTVPHQALLEGVTPADRQRLGLQDAATHSSYDYSAPSKPRGVERIPSPHVPNWPDGAAEQ